MRDCFVQLKALESEVEEDKDGENDDDEEDAIKPSLKEKISTMMDVTRVSCYAAHRSITCGFSLPPCIGTHALGLEFGSEAQLSKRPGSVWNCLWGNALKRSPGIIRKSRVLYPGPGFLSSATWPSLPKKHYNGLNQTKPNMWFHIFENYFKASDIQSYL